MALEGGVDFTQRSFSFWGSLECEWDLWIPNQTLTHSHEWRDYLWVWVECTWSGGREYSRNCIVTATDHYEACRVHVFKVGKASWGENLIILVIYFTYPVNPFIARSGISQLREFPWDRAEFSDYARLQNWKWILPPNVPNRLFYSK